MQSPRPLETSVELASSPPASASLETGDKDDLLVSPPQPHLEDDPSLSPTQTLAASSPELPPLPPFPALTQIHRTPIGRSAAQASDKAYYTARSDVQSSERGYYTASWGSPYQKLPPGYSDNSQLPRPSLLLSSDDFEENSIDQFDLSRLIPSRLPTYAGLSPTRPSTPVRGVQSLQSVLFAPDETLEDVLDTERNDWHSDASSAGGRRSSEGSLDGWDLSTAILDTPLLNQSTAAFRGHNPRAKNLTIRQEDVWQALGRNDERKSAAMQHSKYADVPSPTAKRVALPTEDVAEHDVEQASVENKVEDEGPQAVVHPALPDISTKQLLPATPAPEPARSPLTKKRVPYRGKTLTILLPLDSPRDSNGKTYMPYTRAEAESKLRNAGYFSQGLNAPDAYEHANDLALQTQNRDVYPVAADIVPQNSRPSIKIPVKKDWDDYVDFLTEQKLQALGVSLGDEPAPTPPPGSVPLSRQSSSQYPTSTFSPPPLSSSAASLQHGRNLPGGFVPGHMSRQSMASPLSSIGNPRAIGHMSRQSMFVSPSTLSTNATPPGLGRWSPAQFALQNGNQGHTSPAISALSTTAPISAGGLKTPVSPFQFPATQGFPFNAREDLLQQMQRQQQQLQAQQQQLHVQQQLQAQQQASGMRALPLLDELAEEPEEEEEEEQRLRPAPEIANPRPRHGKNVSIQLERDVQQDGYRLDNYVKQPLPAAIQEPKRDSAGSQPEAMEILVSQDASITNNAGRKSEDSPALDVKKDDVSISRPEGNVKSEDSLDSVTSPTTGSFTTSGHVSKASSISKLNVEAKEFKFNPAATFNPGIFSPNNFSFQPAARTLSFTPSGAFTGVGSNSAEFNPAASVGSTFSGNFDFTSSHASFKPDAPPFDPDTSFGSAGEGDQTDRIFSNINLADIVKPTKKSQAIPIVKPASPASTAYDEPLEDESGRLAQSDARHKRARRLDDDGDDEPLFAFPTHPLDVQVPPSTVKEGSTTPKTEAGAIHQITSPGSAIKGLDDSGFQDGQSETSAIARLTDSLSGGRSIRQSFGHERKKSSLSAAAKPFVYKPWTMETAGSKSDSDVHSDNEEQPKLDTRNQDPELVVDVTQQMKSQLPTGPSPIDRISEHEEIRPDGDNTEDFDIDDLASFNDIDAVMQQLNEADSDAGIERSQPEWSQQSRSRPATGGTQSTPALAVPGMVRSDAPSPSPGKLQSKRLSRDTARDDSEASVFAQDPFSDQAAAAYESGNRFHVLEPQAETQFETQPSDWNDGISSDEAEKMRTRSRFFDNHVDTLLTNALSTRLGPIEQTMQAIQFSLASMTNRSASRRPLRSEQADSDADDEDESGEELGSPMRARSVPRDRKMDKIKAVVQEALSQQPRQKTPARDDALAIEPMEFYQAIADVKASAAFFASQSLQLDDVRITIEEALQKQKAEAAERGAAITSLGPEVQQIAELAKDLAEANARADKAIEAQEKAQTYEAKLKQEIRLLEEEIQLYKAQTKDEEGRLGIFNEERQALKEALRTLEDKQADKDEELTSLTEQNTALESTIKEYRLSHEQWHKDVADAVAEKDKIRNTLEAVQFQAQEAMRVRESMRGRLSALREEMRSAATQMGQQQAKWHRDDEEHRKRYEVLTARLNAEARTRERFEQEMERLESKERESYRVKAQLEEAQNSVKRLEDVVEELRNESSEHARNADKYAREYREARDGGRTELQRTRVLLQAEVEAAKNQMNIVRANLEADIARKDVELEQLKADMDSNRERHELLLEQETDTRREAIREAHQAHKVTLQESAELYEQRLEELRQRHIRAVQHGQEERQVNETRIREEHRVAFKRLIDDKQNSEKLLNDRLLLSDSKVDHLQDKVATLEEKLEVAKSAAHAAVVAAQSAKIPETVASLPTATSHPPAPAEGPGKISPQALRESIAVLQEQLQAREARIEDLETQFEAIDQDAPMKLKERETEITWLRELLGVRADDLSDLINTLASPAFDREAARNAAIRIRANLQMELHEKERLANGGITAQVMPAIASISNFASPKAAQLAAAIGNWRKSSAASTTPSALRTALRSGSNGRAETPSRPSASAQTFLSGLMTPPQSNLRRTPSPEPDAPGTLEMLRRDSTVSNATSRANLSPRSARRIGKQPMFPRSNSLREQAVPERPSTPPLLKQDDYDQDAESASGDFSAQGFFEDESAIMGSGDEEPVPFQTFGSELH